MSNPFKEYIETLQSAHMGNEFEKFKEAFEKYSRVIILGNGGSNSVATHISQDYMKFHGKKVSILSDPSMLTMLTNDFGYEKIFERQLEGLGQKGDLLIVFSTSGQSKNIVNLLKKSKKMRIKSIALLGKTGGQCKKISSYSYVVPSSSTANIQEIHHLIGHIFCSLVD